MGVNATHTITYHWGRMARITTALLAAGALLAAAALADPPVTPAPADPPATSSVVQSVPQIEEDEPGWDCATMGNLICGPQSGTISGPETDR